MAIMPGANVRAVRRKFNRDHRQALIYTDRRSAKVAQLQHCPGAVLVFFDPKRQIQLRAHGRVQLLGEGDALHAERFSQMTEAALGDYARRERPGSPLSDLPSEDTRMAAAGNFMVLAMTLTMIDWLNISRDGHRRAHLRWIEGETAHSWVVP